MKKKELVDVVAKKSNLSTKEVAVVVDSLFESITEAINTDDKVDIKGFGTFNMNHRAARKGRNPMTGEEIQIKASKVPAFKPSKALKEYCNN